MTLAKTTVYLLALMTICKTVTGQEIPHPRLPARFSALLHVTDVIFTLEDDSFDAVYWYDYPGKRVSEFSCQRYDVGGQTISFANGTNIYLVYGAGSNGCTYKNATFCEIKHHEPSNVPVPHLTDYMQYVGQSKVNSTFCNVWGLTRQVPAAVPPYAFDESFGYAISADQDIPVQIGASIYDPSGSMVEDVTVDVLHLEVLDEIDQSVFDVPQLCFEHKKSGQDYLDYSLKRRRGPTITL